MKNVAVLTEDAAFALFFRPHPREFAIQGKKNANAQGSARGGGGGGWGQLELTDALFPRVPLWVKKTNIISCSKRPWSIIGQ